MSHFIGALSTSDVVHKVHVHSFRYFKHITAAIQYKRLTVFRRCLRLIILVLIFAPLSNVLGKTILPESQLTLALQHVYTTVLFKYTMPVMEHEFNHNIR